MLNIIFLLVIVASACFFLYKILRPKLKAYVNCWFCNNNQWVRYYQRNSFTCKTCDQYNGFNESGDYNNVIPSQYIEELNISSPSVKQKYCNKTFTNGLCEICNLLQVLFIERLNKFEAIDERRYFEEFERYKSNLNQKHPICIRCKEYIEQKLQSINEKYFPSAKPARIVSPPKTFTSMKNAAIFVPSHSSSVISETESFSETIFTKPRKRNPSVSSRSSSRSASPFIHRRPPPRSLFSEPPARLPPNITPKITQTSIISPSIVSNFSYKTAPSHYSSVSSKTIKLPPKLYYFSSGKTTVICNILTFFISFILFISFFDESQISREFQLIAFEQYLPMPIINALHFCTKYGSFIAAFVSAIFYYGSHKSDTRLIFADLLAMIAWPIFSIFCIFDGQRNPDFTIIKMIFASYIFILSSVILFFPKLKWKQKFEATTKPSQYSFHSIPSNRSNSYSNLSLPDLPDPVESWLYTTADENQTVTEFHNLRI